MYQTINYVDIETLSSSQIEQALSEYSPKHIERTSHREAAVCLLLRASAGGLEMLFIQRADHPNDPWSGQIAFPGGRREPEDHDLKETGQRETREEISIDLSGEAPVAAKYLGDLDELQGRRASGPIKMVIACSVYLVENSAGAKANEEVQRIDWVALSHLVAKQNQSTVILKKPSLTEARTRVGTQAATEQSLSSEVYPSVNLPYQNLKLWGLTYRFVANLFEKLRAVEQKVLR